VAKLQIEKVLEKKGMSKRQFAKLIVEDYGNVFRFFRPGYDPKLSTLNKWAKALNLKVKDLLIEETSSQ
jgi:hypothetical protein